MKENYTEVPNVISSKDLDYLSDMFNWNYSGYKKSINSSENIIDSEIKQIFEKTTNTFHGIMTDILNILKKGGNNEQ